jgi:hypothetical protein
VKKLHLVSSHTTYLTASLLATSPFGAARAKS